MDQLEFAEQWKLWNYFQRTWQNSPRLKEILHKRSCLELTRKGYRDAIESLKKDVLNSMVEQGMLIGKQAESFGEPQYQPRKPQLPGKKVGIEKVLSTNGGTHLSRTPTPWKRITKYQGGIPGQGKRQ